jgi:hypothetical protein
MRKIIEWALVAVDGVVGSPPLWAMDYRDEEVTRDALRLSIHPVLAGGGLPQFSNGHKRSLRLVSAKTFTSGIVVLSYQTAGA